MGSGTEDAAEGGPVGAVAGPGGTAQGPSSAGLTFWALYRDFFTDVEMEAGPYLNAIYEHTFAERHPSGTAVSFLRPPFDLGFLHYALWGHLMSQQTAAERQVAEARERREAEGELRRDQFGIRRF